MNEGWILFYNDAEDRWELYDNTYDLTIHCRNQAERDRAVEMLREAQQTAREVMRPEDAARILKGICQEHSDVCTGCPFDARSNGEYFCKLKNRADEWDV